MAATQRQSNVAENTTAVTTVTATDVDAGQTKTFSISGGADKALFEIDGTTGVLTFKTAPDFETKADANTDNVYEVTVKVKDGATPVLSDTQDISVNVTDVNEAPVAEDDDYTGTFATTLNVPAPGVLTNDSDVDANTTLTVFDADPDTAGIQPVKAPVNGTLVLRADGSFTYTPTLAFAGDDSFTYKATDGALESKEATVTLHIAANTPPTATDDTATTDEDTFVDIDVITNDTDLESANANLSVVPDSIAAVKGGTADLQADNRTIRFTPDTNANDGNTADGFGFTYKVTDGVSASLTASDSDHHGQRRQRRAKHTHPVRQPSGRKPTGREHSGHLFIHRCG